MINTDETGRRKSRRTSAELEAMLEDEIKSLSPEGAALLRSVMEQVQAGDTEILDAMHRSRYKRPMVSVEQFLEDPYYLGNSTQTLYPRIREDLIEALGGHNYREMVLTGSIGYGKTTFASIAVCWMLYAISCLRSPHLAYGLSPGSEIVVALISKTLDLARGVLKSAVDDKLKLSAYFMNEIEIKIARDRTMLPDNVVLIIDSVNASRVLGMNVIGGALDEANFMARKGQVIGGGARKKTVAHYDMAEKVYASLVRRIKSRFISAAFDLPGLMVLASSAAMIGSFTDRKLAASKNDPTVFARDYATWMVKNESDFSGRYFKLLIGNNSFRNRILKPNEHQNIPTYKQEGCRVIDVPEEYREDFERDLENAVRDVAGISTHAISAFIHRVDKIEECITPKMKHPFTVEEYVFGDQGGFMWDRITRSYKKTLVSGIEETKWLPLRRPEVSRHIHIDTSLSGDATGIAMGYVDRWVEVVRRNQSGEEYNDIAPFVVIEFMLRIEPPAGEQIFLPEIRSMVYEIRQHGFHIGKVTCDSYQSAEMIQQLKAQGIRAEVQSVDRTTEPYERLKSAIYEDRILFYRYEPFIEELKKLEYDRIKGKVDHPQAGTKDVSDAVAGVVQTLIDSSASQPIRLTSTRQGVNDSLTWVTEGKKIPVDPSNPTPRGSKTKSGMPLPFLMG